MKLEQPTTLGCCEACCNAITWEPGQNQECYVVEQDFKIEDDGSEWTFTWYYHNQCRPEWITAT